MPEYVEFTVQTPIWPLKTEAQMDKAGWELFRDFRTAANTVRSWSEFQQPIVQLHVYGPIGMLAADLGKTLVKVNGVFEALTDEELVERGFPVSPIPSTDTP